LDSWLARSRQAWKIRWSQISALLGPLLIFVTAPNLRRWGPVPMLLGLALGVLSIVLPHLVRCRVCGLQLHTSSEARRQPRFQVDNWITSLQLCPICLDDGWATAESRERWLQSGRTPEEPYWGMDRVALAILAVLLMLVSAFMVGEIYRVKP
jgi:hypothetical protein